MRIALIVEGKTEGVFRNALRCFLEGRLKGCMPRLDMVPYRHRIPKGVKLRKDVEKLLSGNNPADAVIALTDVYTGPPPPPPDFTDAADAKRKMREWVGPEQRFHPHAAQYEFEAWLLPYWSELQRLAGHNAAAPGADPEKVNHTNPPSKRLEELFNKGKKRVYSKTRDASRILREADMTVAVGQCSELKALVNTILSLCGGETIP